LKNPDSELIIFDVNRADQIEPLIPAANKNPLQQLETRTDLPYRLTVITNVAGDSSQLTQRSKAPRSNTVNDKPLQMAWPRNVYSLSHLAIPFAPDDPVYGIGDV